MFFNYLVDPLQYYRRVESYPLYVNDRWQVPAFIRSFSFDSAIVGTSMTQNFSLQQIRSTLGDNAIKLSIAGSNISEQLLVLQMLLKNKKVKKILWGLDRHYFYVTDPRPLTKMPISLYRGFFDAHLVYLLNIDTLFQAMRVLCSKVDPIKELENYNGWGEKEDYSKKKVLEQYYASLKEKKTLAPMSDPEVILKEVCTLIKKNPEIQFIIFLPPYSIAFQKKGCALNKAHYYKDFKFRERLLKDLTQFKNVKLFDFETDLTVVADLNNYKDLTHYSKLINDHIICQIALNSKRISTSSDIKFSQELFLSLPFQPFKK